MYFQRPEAFYLILPLAFIVLGLALYARAMRRRAMAAFVDSAMAPRILPEESALRFWGKLALWELGMIFALMALARPQWGEVVEDVKVKGSDLYVLIDVSRSMLCTDVPPNRLERAKADVSSLLNRLKGERVGLIAFAGRAAVKCPLTADYPFFRAALNELGPNSVERGGTAIGDAIRTALNVLPKAPDRDQAILLITDGDDQDSDPLHAAALAAERHIVIFTVGLGDPTEGSKVPDKLSDGKALQYDGKDVVSKMDDKVLRDIALEAKGKYVPARTSAYDLGQLYEENLSQLRGEYAKEQKRKRMAERFEIPLALALLCFTLEMLIRPYRRKTDQPELGGAVMKHKPKAIAQTAGFALALLLPAMAANANAGDARDLAKVGMLLYSKKEYAAASEKFDEAGKAIPPEERELAARTAYDAGCAFQRKGDLEKARDAYKRATAARDKVVAAGAQYNLGQLAADEAKTAAGEKPEAVAPDKRQDVISKLLKAVEHYRNCIEIDTNHAQARKNIELIRQWIKLYSNKWAEIDRQKRRDEMDLFKFLDFITQTERGLRVTSRAMSEYASADDYAELKRAQDELADEVEPLKQKIEKALTEPNPNPQAPKPSPEEDKQRAEGLKTLTEMANLSGRKMLEASGKLLGSQAQEAAQLQFESAQTLDQIYEAIAPFGLQLGRDLAEQTRVTDVLKPPVKEEQKEYLKDDSKKIAMEKKDDKKPAEERKSDEAPATETPLTKEEFSDLTELQTDVSRRTQQLKMKAEREMAEVEKNMPKVPEKPKDKEKEKEWLTVEDMKKEEARKKLEEEKKKAAADPANKDKKEPESDGPPTPEQIKKGLQKAIELAPKAAEKMNAAIEHLKKQDRAGAYPDAEEARKLLQEIADAQPKQKKKDEDKKKDEEQKKQDEQKKEDDKKKDDDKKKGDEKKDDDKKKESDKKDEKKDDKDKKKEDEKKDAKAAPQQMSKEQAEAMLRKVRERELDHRKKKQDEQNVILGRSPGVERDW